MAKAHALVVHKSLISWITSKNRWLQVLLVATAIIAVLANVLPLEMQKRIVNAVFSRGPPDASTPSKQRPSNVK